MFHKDSRPFAGPGHVTYPPLNLRPGTLWIPDMERAGTATFEVCSIGIQNLPSSNFFPYNPLTDFRYLNCCQILYSNTTDFKLGSSTYFFLLFSFLVLTKCQVLNIRVGGHVTRSCKGPIGSDLSCWSSSSSSSSTWPNGSDESDSMLLRMTRLSLLEDSNSWSWKWLKRTLHTLTDENLSDYMHSW